MRRALSRCNRSAKGGQAFGSSERVTVVLSHSIPASSKASTTPSRSSSAALTDTATRNTSSSKSAQPSPVIRDQPNKTTRSAQRPSGCFGHTDPLVRARAGRLRLARGPLGAISRRRPPRRRCASCACPGSAHATPALLRGRAASVRRSGSRASRSRATHRDSAGRRND